MAGVTYPIPPPPALGNGGGSNSNWAYANWTAQYGYTGAPAAAAGWANQQNLLHTQPVAVVPMPTTPGASGGASTGASGGTAQTPSPTPDPVEQALLDYLTASQGTGGAAPGSASSLPQAVTTADVAPATTSSGNPMLILIVILAIGVGGYFLYKHFADGAGIGGAIAGAIEHKPPAHHKAEGE